MPSKTSTFLLALLAIVFGTLAGVQLAQDDLSSFFGAPARRAGDQLYSFNLEKVQAISIRNSTGETIRAEKRDGAWFLGPPINDRADYRDMQRIVFFSRHLRVEDVLRRNETTLEETGMRTVGRRAGRFKVELEDSTGKMVADYRLGRRTAWHRLDDESGKTSETFFVRPNETGQKDYIYVCSAPPEIRPSVRQTLERGFARLRDHRPFLFDPFTVAEVGIKYRGSEIVIARDEPAKSGWRMTKPLESRTKPEAIAQLLQGLYDLEAIEVHQRDSVTIAPTTTTDAFLEISLRLFDGQGQPQKYAATLSVQPPSGENADTVYATMPLTRPEAVFELPLKPASGKTSLSELPLAVDELRSRTLASLNIGALRYITIHAQSRRQPIQIFLNKTRNTGEWRWLLNDEGEVKPANEFAIGAILEAVSRDEVVSFASESASNLAEFGLNPPHKRLVLQGGEDGKEVLDLFFGRGSDGKFYAMRRGSSTVTEIGTGTWSAVATASYEWRDTLLMPFSIVDLAAMKIQWPATPPLLDPALILNYEFLDESWTARQFGEDATARLNAQRANKFIQFLESLRVEKWLSPNTPRAEAVLRDPVYRFTAVFRETDDDGEQTGVRQISFEIAPASQSPVNQYYYGRISDDPNYFLLSLDTVKVLAVDLLDPE